MVLFEKKVRQYFCLSPDKQHVWKQEEEEICHICPESEVSVSAIWKQDMSDNKTNVFYWVGCCNKRQGEGGGMRQWDTHAEVCTKSTAAEQSACHVTQHAVNTCFQFRETDTNCYVKVNVKGGGLFDSRWFPLWPKMSKVIRQPVNQLTQSPWW